MRALPCSDAQQTYADRVRDIATAAPPQADTKPTAETHKLRYSDALSTHKHIYCTICTWTFLLGSWTGRQNEYSLDDDYRIHLK